MENYSWSQGTIPPYRLSKTSLKEIREPLWLQNMPLSLRTVKSYWPGFLRAENLKDILVHSRTDYPATQHASITGVTDQNPCEKQIADTAKL